MNIIAQLEFELTYYDSVVQRFNHYTMRTQGYLCLLNKTKGFDTKKSLNVVSTSAMEYNFFNIKDWKKR